MSKKMTAFTICRRNRLKVETQIPSMAKSMDCPAPQLESKESSLPPGQKSPYKLQKKKNSIYLQNSLSILLYSEDSNRGAGNRLPYKVLATSSNGICRFVNFIVKCSAGFSYNFKGNLCKPWHRFGCKYLSYLAFYSASKLWRLWDAKPGCLSKNTLTPLCHTHHITTIKAVWSTVSGGVLS